MAQDLLDLLNRENALIDETLAGGPSLNEKYGEGWGEYYAHVRNACREFCGSGQRVLEALVGGAYHEDSPSSIELARAHGSAVLDHLLTQSRSRVPLIRDRAIRMLGVVGEENRGLSAARRTDIRNAAILAIQDSTSLIVQQAGVAAIGRAGSQRDVAMLQRIATTDNQKVLDGARVVYPLRDAAWRAIKRINARPAVP